MELIRTKSAEEIEATSDILREAGVPFRVGGTGAGFDASEIGRSDFPADIFVTVSDTDFDRAREALEKVYMESELPEDHFLNFASDSEICEMLSLPSEWAAFDIAHARKLAVQRNIDQTVIATRSAQRVADLSGGRIVPRTQWVYGWASACFGGVIGIAMGYAIAYMKDKTPDGEFYRYDQASRKIGFRLMIFSLFMLAATRLAYVIYMDLR